MVAGVRCRRRGSSDKTQAPLFSGRLGHLISYAIRGGPSKCADYVARTLPIKHEEAGREGKREEERAACMSQQPPMSSFSALEFHAGHYKGAASLRCRGGAVTGRPRCHFGEPLYNARGISCRNTFSKRLSSVGRTDNPLCPRACQIMLVARENLETCAICSEIKYRS